MGVLPAYESSPRYHLSKTLSLDGVPSDILWYFDIVVASCVQKGICIIFVIGFSINLPECLLYNQLINCIWCIFNIGILCVFGNYSSKKCKISEIMFAEIYAYLYKHNLTNYAFHNFRKYIEFQFYTQEVLFLDFLRNEVTLILQRLVDFDNKFYAHDPLKYLLLVSFRMLCVSFQYVKVRLYPSLWLSVH